MMLVWEPAPPSIGGCLARAAGAQQWVLWAHLTRRSCPGRAGEDRGLRMSRVSLGCLRRLTIKQLSDIGLLITPRSVGSDEARTDSGVPGGVRGSWAMPAALYRAGGYRCIAIGCIACASTVPPAWDRVS